MPSHPRPAVPGSRVARVAAEGETAGTIARREWLLLLVAFFLGLTLRCGALSGQAIEHFDEGVYASNRWFGEQAQQPGQSFQYPNRHLYAPPLLPALIEWSCIIFGPSNMAALLPSLVAGAVLIPMTWMLMRSWFGPSAAIAAAMLVATSDLHQVFSRAALTDIWLLVWLLSAVAVGSRAIEDRSWGAAVFAGLLTSLGWWTKYNGWLPLAILGAGGLGWRLSTLRERETPGTVVRPEGKSSPLRRAGSFVALWLVIALTAAACWSPYLFSLYDGRGGYAAVAANHRGYLVGWECWWHSLVRQGENLWAFTGGWTVVGGALALLAAVWVAQPAGDDSTWNLRSGWQRTAGQCLCTACCVAGAMAWLPAALLLGGLALCIAWLARGAWRASTSESQAAERLPLWLLSAWFLGLLLTTPLYTPYPRLALPWWFSANLLLAVGLGRWSAGTCSSALCPVPSDLERVSPGRCCRGLTFLCGALGIGMLLAATPHLRHTGFPAWQSRTAQRDLAQQILQEIEQELKLPTRGSGEQFAIYTYAEPALLFQLRLQGALFVSPVQHLAFAKPTAPNPTLPSYVVLGPQGERTPGYAKQLAESRPRMRKVRSWSHTSSLLVSRDTPADHGREQLGSEEEVALYRILPRASE